VPRLAVSLLCLASVGLASAPAQSPEQVKATVRFVRGLQTDAGGFLPGPPGRGDGKPGVRATASALRALKYFGGEPKDRKAAARFVAACIDKDSGGIADQPGGKPDVLSTAVGAMAAFELKLPPESYAPAAVRYLSEHARTFEDVRIAAAAMESLGRRAPATGDWLALIAKTRNPDGTWGKGDGQARDTGGAVAAVLRLGGKIDQRDNVVRALKAGQRPDGGFGKAGARGSDLETTYRVMRSLVMLKERPDVAKCRAFVAKCRNEDGGYGVAPGQPSTVSGTYFAAIILHWLGEK